MVKQVLNLIMHRNTPNVSIPACQNPEKEKHERVVETGEIAQMKKQEKFNYQNKYWICLITGEEGNDQVSKFLQLKDNTHTENLKQGSPEI